MILSINTGSEKNSIAIFGDNVAKEQSWQSYRTQSKELLPKIDKLLKSGKINPKNLKAIAVYQGPGSFTGLRVGISVADAMAWSLNIPVIGIKDGQTVKLLNGQGKYNNLAIKQFNNLNALEIAQKAEKIYKKTKNKKFSKTVIPHYGSPLK